MSPKKLRFYLLASIVFTVGALGATIGAGNEPSLGLDLQGGISIVYEPVGRFTPRTLDQAVQIIQDRVNGLGVAEPEISRQGNTISVDLPGVKDRDKASRIVGETAELRFRPVLLELPRDTPATTTTTAPPGTGSSSTSSTSSTTTTTLEAATTTTTTNASTEAARAAIAACDVEQVFALAAAGSRIPTTSREGNTRDACVVLPLRDAAGGIARLLLGPAPLTGQGVESAKRRFAQGQGYTVEMTLTAEGLSTFSQMASEQVSQSPPLNQVAIELDGTVQSAPAFQTGSFDGPVEISGSFTADEAEDLATVISYGALPVQLQKLSTSSVSPTLGSDQLDAGIAAGAIGLVLVAAYMLLYYRVLGLVVILGLGMTSILVYALVSYLSVTNGLALTLAGVTGLIVSTGVTVDSYVVYFERLKDEVRKGRTVRSSVDRGFAASFRTILAGDLVSLIGAGALYFIAIGSVRGFALFLGISTILDLAVSYFFMHPLVSLMARKPALVRMRGVGMAAGLDAPGATA